MPVLGADTIIVCFEHFAIEVGAGRREFDHKVLAGLFLALERYSTPTTPLRRFHDNPKPSPFLVTPSNAFRSSTLVPSQVKIRASSSRSGIADAAIHSNKNTLKIADILKLKQIKMWPLSSKKGEVSNIRENLVSIDSLTVLVRSQQFQKFSADQTKCFEIFQNRITILDEELLLAANSIGMY